MEILDKQTLDKLQKFECPDCGGRLLRGIRTNGMSIAYTCGSCASKFTLRGVDCNMFMGADRDGKDAAGAAYYDPSSAPRDCDYCGTSYTGPAVYCSLGCAVDAAG